MRLMATGGSGLRLAAASLRPSFHSGPLLGKVRLRRGGTRCWSAPQPRPFSGGPLCHEHEIRRHERRLVAQNRELDRGGSARSIHIPEQLAGAGIEEHLPARRRRSRSRPGRSGAGHELTGAQGTAAQPAAEAGLRELDPVPFARIEIDDVVGIGGARLRELERVRAVRLPTSVVAWVPPCVARLSVGAELEPPAPPPVAGPLGPVPGSLGGGVYC